MSKENVKMFYMELERNRELYEEAISFQEKFTEQEEVIEVFLELARRNGYPFEAEELAAYIFENGQEEKHC